MDGKNSNPNPNPNLSPYKQKLAVYFLRALAGINQSTPRPSSPPQRSRNIKRTAYASMAYAAGPRRAWSRALLCRLHGRSTRSPSAQRVILIRRRVRVARSRAGEPNRSHDLRNLVPGGNGMDFCSLLEETAHYIQCLSLQVQLMQTVVDSASSH